MLFLVERRSNSLDRFQLSTQLQRRKIIMGATNVIKMFERAGLEAGRGVEGNKLPAEDFVLVLDENDSLYCPGVNDAPSPALVNSIRNNGWQKGSLLLCVNRGAKGKAPIAVVSDGRSRLKAVKVVNVEREAAGLDPIEPEFIFLTEEEAYGAMHIGNERQDRSPLFEARRWAQFKKIFSVKAGTASLSDEKLSEARKEYAKLIKCSAGRIKGWELLLEAHPEVLRMCEDRALSAAAVKDIVRSTAYADQPTVALSLAKKRDVEPVIDAEPVTTAPAEEAAPAKPARKARAEALGMKDESKPIPSRHLRLLLAEMRATATKDESELDLVDPSVMLAWLLGETEFDGAPIADHPSMVEVLKLAKRAGVKVAK